MAESNKRNVLALSRMWDKHYIAMLYVNAAVLLQDMATPREMVEERLAELGMSKTELAQSLGYKTYQGYHDLFVSGRTKLTPRKLEEVAEALRWPRDHFKNPVNTLKREDYIRREFGKFLASEVGREANRETVKVLESMKWTGDVLPTKKLYIAVTLAMEERYRPVQLLDAIRLEAEDEDDDEEEELVTPKPKRNHR